NPAILAALQRRSPTRIMYVSLPSSHRTRTGCNWPLVLSDSANRPSESSSNSSRGWSGSGTIFSTGISPAVLILVTPSHRAGADGAGAGASAGRAGRPTPILSWTLPAVSRESSSSFPMSGGLRVARGNGLGFQPGQQLLGEHLHRLRRGTPRLVLRDRHPPGNGFNELHGLGDAGREDIIPVGAPELALIELVDRPSGLDHCDEVAQEAEARVGPGDDARHGVLHRGDPLRPVVLGLEWPDPVIA